MKYFIQFLFLILSVIVNGQIKYFQDFENGFNDMILVDQDGKMPALPVADFPGSWNIAETEEGNNWAVSNSYFTEPGRASDWMITPVISDISDKTVLNWKAFSYNSLFQDQYEVRVSPTGGSNLTDFTKIIFSIDGENTYETLRGLSLAEFTGKNIRIAFRNNSNDKYLLYIDDITVEDVFKYDAKAVELKIDRYLAYYQSDMPKISIMNVGSGEINEIVFDIIFDGKIYKHSAPGLKLKYLEAYSFNSPISIEFDFPLKKEIELLVTHVNDDPDQNSENNSLKKYMHFLENDWQRKLFIEENTSTLCGWCTKGIHFINELEKNYKDEFVHLSIHNNDPMEHFIYTDGFNEIYKFDNYPSIVIDRKEVIDPSKIEFTFSQNRSNVAPLKFNINPSKFNREISLNGNVEFNTQFMSDNLSLIVTVVEDDVMGNGIGYNQSNIYSGGAFGELGGFENLPNPILAENIKYRNVVRQLPLGFDGDKTLLNNTYQFGSTENIDLTFTIDEDIIIENASIILSVKDSDEEVIASSQIKLKEVSSKEVIENEFEIFPNPSDGLISFFLNELEINSINIFDNTSRLVYKLNDVKSDLDLSFLEDGYYLMKLSIKEKVIFKKIIIQH